MTIVTDFQDFGTFRSGANTDRKHAAGDVAVAVTIGPGIASDPFHAPTRRLATAEEAAKRDAEPQPAWRGRPDG
ncbi:MAG: hypothetical protein U0P45_11520 [Acidimicrobiales bacterium]